jgi:hypothetical protein
VSKSADPTAGWLGLAIGSDSTDQLFGLNIEKLSYGASWMLV